ncbi:unnamed protein product [Closterium sp. NIES-64]|nr:unnamed protein product [Closterium sp. NIES-64]
MVTFEAHVLKDLPPEYGFLRRKLGRVTVERVCSPDMTVERVCSEAFIEEHTLSIEQSYKQTNDAYTFSGAVNTIVATTGPEENDEVASLTTYAVGIEAMLNLPHTHLENDYAGAVKWTATNGGVLVMDLEKGGEDTSSASSQEAKLTRQTLPLPDEQEGEVLRMVHGPEQNQPLSRSIIMVPVPSVQEGEQLLDRSVGPLSSKAPTTPPPLGPPSVANSAPVGLEDGPMEVGTSMADHEDEEEVAVDEQSPMAHEHEPSPAVSPIQPIPPPPRRSSRPNKGVPPVRFQPLSMTAQDANDKDNPYDVAYLTEDDCDTDSDDEVEYPDEDEEEEGAWGGVILDLAAALTGHEGKE